MLTTEWDKIVVVTRKTGLEELLERFVTREQARFYLEHSGVPFEPYEEEQRTHDEALTRLKAALPGGVRSQFVERSFLPTFAFGERDLVVTLGPDGMVVNVAKYLRDAQLILAFNPDPSRIDGILIPFRVGEARGAIQSVLHGDYRVREVTMARATLGDGQSLLAFNDLFIGRKTHVSARYRISHRRRSEDQSSSGIIVSTGAGSTGWLSSVLNGAAGVVEPFAGAKAVAPVRSGFRFAWDAPRLCFSVREPFVSKASAAGIVWGNVRAGEKLEVVSQMPQNGVIFSDGVEADYLAFDSGMVASISVAEERARLVAA
jgi:NAD kinase